MGGTDHNRRAVCTIFKRQVGRDLLCGQVKSPE
jgi:hypothetical protein